MCGRFAFYSPSEAAAALFGVSEHVAVEPRYNIAPTQYVAAIRTGEGQGSTTQRESILRRDRRLAVADNQRLFSPSIQQQQPGQVLTQVQVEGVGLERFAKKRRT